MRAVVKNNRKIRKKQSKKEVTKKEKIKRIKKEAKKTPQSSSPSVAKNKNRLKMSATLI